MPRRRELHQHRAGYLALDVLPDRAGARSRRRCTAARAWARGRRARSARLSDMNVTRAKRAAISGSVWQKLAVSSSPSSGRSGLPMITGRHRARPAQEVAVQRLQQLLDVLAAEPARVAAVVDVAGGRADEDEPADPLRVASRGQDADHRAHRVADEDRVGQRRARGRSRPRRRRSRRGSRSAPGRTPTGPSHSGPDVIEEHDPMIRLERGRHEAPHVLVAAEPVREDHRAAVRASGDVDVVAREDAQSSAPGGNT